METKLSKKRKNFSPFFAAFLKSTLHFEHFEQKDERHSYFISQNTVSEIRDCEKRGYWNVLKASFSNTTLNRNWNLEGSPFIKLFQQFGKNWAENFLS